MEASVNYQRFIITYGKHLRLAFLNTPEDYMGTFEGTFAKMCEAIKRGSFNKDSKTFKATCKELGIPHTYKAIKGYVTGTNESAEG